VSTRTVDLDPARWARVEQLFEQAAALAADERAAFLDQACADDPELRAYLVSLLDSDMAQSTLVESAIRDVLRSTVAALDETADNAGVRIGPYRIVRTIGTGGMGVVYLAERADEQFEQQVAIKVVRQRLLDPDVQKRLLSERQILANLDHPNIARLFDGGTLHDGTPYLVMEYIDGLPIDEYCDRKNLGIDARLRLFRTVLQAIHHAHQNLVVHRDIKTSNILVTADGSPKLLDFGIARLLEQGDAPAAGLTRAGAVILTPENAAPEQVTHGPITTATDTYALGILLYRLLTGRAPYEVSMSRPAEIPRIICHSEPLPPSTVVRQAPGSAAVHGAAPADELAAHRDSTPARLARRLRGDLDNIVHTAMHKEPERRYRSANEFAEDLRRHLQAHPVLARPDSWHYRTSRFLRRHTAGAAMSALLVAVLLASAVTLTIQNRRIVEERDTAMEIAAFLEDIFQEPDPGNARGANITAREILGKGAARISTELDDRPAIQATLMSTIGRVYFNLGEYDPSIAMLEEALEIRRELFGDNDPAVAANENELAASLTRKADYGRAEALLRDALAHNRRLHGERSAQVASNKVNLAELYQATGDPQAAEANARAAVDIYAALGETQAAELAEAKSLLSRILQWQNRLDEAEVLLREAIDTVETHLGPNHPLLAYYLQNLAVLAQSNGELDAAEDLFHQAIAATRKILGEDHSLLGGSLVMLGRLLHQRGQYDAAEAALRDALRVHRKARGAAHPFVGYDMVSLGMLLSDKGEFGDAEAALRGALKIYEESLSPDHQYVASALTELGAVLTNDGRAAEARELLDRAIDIRRRDYGANHPLLAATLTVSGHNLAVLQRYAQAEPLLLDNYAVLRKQTGDDDRRAQQARRWIVELYEAWGRPRQADRFRSMLPD